MPSLLGDPAFLKTILAPDALFWHGQSQREQYAYFYKLACVSRSWRSTAVYSMSSADWARPFTSGAARLQATIKNLPRDGFDVPNASVTEIADGLAHHVVCRDEALQASGVAALLGLATEGFRVLVAKSSVNAVVGAMTFHPDNPALAATGLRLLVSHCVCYRDRAWGEWTPRQCAATVCVVRAAMRRFPQDLALQHAGVDFLCRCTNDYLSLGGERTWQEQTTWLEQIDASRAAVADTGCIELAVATMQALGGRLVGPQQQSLDVLVLKLLGYYAREHRAGWWQSTAGFAALEVVVGRATAAVSRNDRYVTHRVVKLLDVLLVCPDMAPLVTEAGGVELCVQMLRVLDPASDTGAPASNTVWRAPRTFPRHPYEVYVRKTVCSVLAALARDDRCVERLVATEHCLVQIVRAVHPPSTAADRADACVALCTVARVDTASRMLVRGCGGVHALEVALADCSVFAVPFASITRALVHLVAIPEYVTLFNDTRVPRMLQNKVPSAWRRRLCCVTEVAGDLGTAIRALMAGRRTSARLSAR